MIIAFWTFLTKGVSLDFLEEKLCGPHKFNWASNSQSLLCRSTDTTKCHPFRVLARKIELLGRLGIYIYIYIYIFPPLKKKNIYCQRRELAEKDTKESVSKTEHSQNVHYTQLWFKLQNDMGRS